MIKLNPLLGVFLSQAYNLWLVLVFYFFKNEQKQEERFHNQPVILSTMRVESD